MKLLVIGDVVGEAGIDALHGLLRRIKRDTGADFVIVNGENAAGNGVLPRQADDIFAAGADVITLGNHVFGKQQIVPYLDSRSDVLRPANLAPQSPGRGWGIYDGPQGMRLLVMNLIGRCDMKYGPDNPFLCADRYRARLTAELNEIVPAGVLYVPVRDELPDAARDTDEDGLRILRDKALRRSGLLSDDMSLLAAMEHGLEGDGRFIPVSIKIGKGEVIRWCVNFCAYLQNPASVRAIHLHRNLFLL